MKPKAAQSVQSPRVAGELAALQRAALRAREIALRTNTALVIEQDGKLVRVDPRSVS